MAKVDDVVESILRLLKKNIESDDKFDFMNPNPSTSWAPFMIFNIGNSNPTKLTEFISAIEKELGIKAERKLLPMQEGDVAETSANTEKLQKWINYKPDTSVEKGIKNFVEWYLKYYKINLKNKT